MSPRDADPGVNYAQPDTPPAVRIANRLARPVAPWLVPLGAASLKRSAERATGLNDFGDRRFEEPLRILTEALDAEAKLNLLGRISVRQLLVGLLQTRLRVEDLLKRRPEILAERIEAPIVILGLPRTGTTLLQRLLAQDPGLRHLPYWESMTPLPPGDAALPPPSPDPRVRRAEQSLAFLHYVAPLMIGMHEMEATAPDEEIWLMAVDFASMLFEASYRVPSFSEWYQRTDQTPGYAYLRRMLQVLQWYRRGERWLLKSPQHLEQIGPLLRTFPDATVVQTHRDPLAVTASLSSTTAYGRRLNTDHPDPREIGHVWARRIETMLRRSVEDRPSGSRRFVDVHFRTLARDPIAEVRRVYAAAARELAPAAEAAMRTWLAANPAAKHGKHVYRLADFGLDRDELRAALRFYTERFDIPED